MDLDMSEVAALAVGFKAAVREVPDAARDVVAKSGERVRNDARSRISGHPSWRKLAGTINTASKNTVVVSSVEVGYDRRGQGKLANIAEFGSARHAPHPALIPAARAEIPVFEKAMGDLIGKLL